METQFDISDILANGVIRDELDFERALVADRKLRVLAKNNPELKKVRSKLRDLLSKYEDKHWSSSSTVSAEQIRESDLAELIAEMERQFIKRRKELIRTKLKASDLTQQDFGRILGHNSKSYMSELMNGLSPFSLRDLIVIHRLLKIELTELVPTILSQAEREKIIKTLDQLNNPKIKLSKTDLLEV